MSSSTAPSLPAGAGQPSGGGNADSPAPPPEVRTFQHYEVLRRPDGTPWELGRGTMGITYKAVDTNLRSEVALKVVNSTVINHPNARERFVREARAAAALRHHNVASVYHLGSDGETFFYAMEFIDGETLDALVRRQGPLPVGTALRLALQAARALAAAARQKLVHRDIKPANLMVVHEDADEHMVVKVIDFGLARPTAGDDGADGSGTGGLTIHGFVGTPQYASPEQLEERTLDARSDIYSLGVTLWFLLTGKPPFIGSLAGIIHQHLSKEPPWPHLPASVPEAARRLLAHMLEKNPADRPQSAVDLRYEIEACLQALHTPAPAPATPADAPVAGGVASGNAGLISKLFGGLGRPRDTTATPALAEIPPASDIAASPAAPAAGTWPEAGTILAERYELAALVGEGGSGRVFEARDRANDGGTIAIKILRPGTGGVNEAAREKMRDDARQVAAAPHPNLTELFAFELAPESARSTPSYIAEEWLRGFTLRDLLAARNGALPAAEALRLLKQAASAVDHAASRRLERLELGIHQIHLHFPARTPVSPKAPGPRALLQMSMEEWPEWSLKIEPFGVSRDAGESHTWTGEVTLLPGNPLPSGWTTPENGPSLEATYLHALARIACELLGGQPPGQAATSKYVSLPTLNEAGNTVLARALSETAGFDSAWKFYENFALAAGFSADAITPLATNPFEQFLPEPSPPPPAAALLSTVSVPAARATESAAAQTRLRPADSAHAEDLDNARTEPDRSPLPYRPHAGSLDTTDPDPWRESQLARLIEEEDKRKLVDSSSTGFALTVGAVIGLLLLMIGFGAMVWYRGFWGTPATRQPAPPPATAKHTPPAKTAPLQKARAALSTPPPLPPAAETATPPASASPVLAATGNSTNSPLTPQPVLSPDEARKRPNPTPRFDDRTISLEIRSDPSGADIFLDEASLGRTPVKVTLPPGDYEFVAHYRGWPEVRQDMHLSADQAELSTDIHLISPGQLPIGASPPAVAETPRRHRRENSTSEREEGERATPVVPSENARVYRAKPVPSEPPANGEPGEPAVRRALPVPEPFLPHRETPTTQLPEAKPTVPRD